MLSRLLHAAIAFVITGALYQGYVLAVAPLIDPAPTGGATTERRRPGDEPREAKPIARYQKLLASYFPPDHWTAEGNPKVLENGQVMIVIADYHEQQDGHIVAKQCAMLMFPSPRTGGEAPRDAIIMEPSGGVELEGQPTGNSAVASFSQPDRAWLHGAVKIRSDMREPGPADDLEITTREVYINRDFIRTDQRVEMRLGPHFGGGRGLEIRLLSGDGGRRAGSESTLGRFESLEIPHDVSLEIVAAGLSLPDNPARSGGVAQPAAPEPPISVKSRGAFRVDFGNDVASFIDGVTVRQIHDGVPDTLTADEVILYFARSRNTKSSRVSNRSSSSPLGAGFELATIEARTIDSKEGPSKPVKLIAPFRAAAAECKRLRVELQHQRITVAGDNEDVVLSYQGAEIHAPLVQYQHPSEESGRVLGELVASGAGHLKAIVDKRRPHEPLEVRWTDALRIDRVDGRPVLSIRGRPRMALAATGRMWADQLELVLAERPVDPAAAAASPLPWAVAPERLTATGNVDIDSPELIARVEQLRLNFQYAATAPGELGLSGADGSGADSRIDPLARLGRAARRTYRVTGRWLDLVSVVRDGKADVSRIEMGDNVLFEEAPTPDAKEAPLRMTADRLRVVDADTPAAKIDIIGREARPGVAAELAQITARGATLSAPKIAIVRGRSQVQIESPGEVQLLMDRDLSGQPLARPEPLTISWQKWMRLNRDRLIFRGDVLCKNSSGWLRTRQLGVGLSQEVSFDGGSHGARPEVIQLDCSEGVVAEFDQRDATGLTSHQHLELVSILANQKTGEIRGEGPGWMESVHLSTGKNPLAAIGAPGGAPANNPADNAPGQKLRHLRIDFARGVGGNVHQRMVSLLGDVRAVYGPVDSWEQRLQRAVGAGPGPNVVWLSSDELRVGESPLARVSRPPQSSGLAELELTALGKVIIEGQAPGRGLFAANASRASYDEYKGMFILEGDQAHPAVIRHQAYVGAPYSEDVARKLTYNQRTGDVKQEGVHKIEFNQFDLGRQPGGTQSR